MKKVYGCLIYLSVILTIPLVFLLNVAHGEYTYTTIDVVGPPRLTEAWGISGSSIVGEYENENGIYQGFLYSGGNYTTFNVPNAIETFPYGISGSSILGYYVEANHEAQGFLYSGGNYTTLNVPDAVKTYLYGISGDTIVGEYVDANSEIHGFLYNGGIYTPLMVPDAIMTHPCGISGSSIVGYFLKANTYHGFLYSGGNYAAFDVPGAVMTYARGISGNNIVGYYVDATNQYHGFLYNGRRYTTLDVPGALSTEAYGINGNNLVGFYVDANQYVHGFLTTLPEPISIDIRLGNKRTPINYKSHGVLTVAILSTKDFDAPSQVDQKSLTFGSTGDEHSLASCNHRPKDVNQDGFDDLVCDFHIAGTGFECSDTEGFLKAETVQGTLIEGSGLVQIEPCK